MTEIVIPIFDRFTALDAVGPYEVLSRIPGATVTFIAARTGEYRTETGRLGLIADGTYEEHRHPDVLVFPGGFGTRELAQDEALLDWVREAHAHSTWTTSVCTGSLVLGAAGILQGLKATTHWMLLDALAEYGAVPVSERVVRQGRVITAAGVSAGIDMAIGLAAELTSPELAQAIQLGIEYDPDPPFVGGSVATASPEIVDLVRSAALA